MLNRVARAIKQAKEALIVAAAVVGIITFFINFLGRSLTVAILNLLGTGFVIYLLTIIGSHLVRLEERMERGFEGIERGLKEMSRKSGNPNAGEPEPPVKPSGGGAFAGMIIGGALGLPFGPAGVLIGGIMGALIGNQIEYDDLQRKRRERK